MSLLLLLLKVLLLLLLPHHGLSLLLLELRIMLLLLHPRVLQWRRLRVGVGSLIQHLLMLVGLRVMLGCLRWLLRLHLHSVDTWRRVVRWHVRRGRQLRRPVMRGRHRLQYRSVLLRTRGLW